MNLQEGCRPPVVSDTVEEAVAVVHHGSDGAEDGGVAHQAGRQDKVPAAAAADTQARPVRDGQVGGLGSSCGFLSLVSHTSPWETISRGT